MFKDTVEVISVTRAFDGATGDPTFQIQFGHMVEMDEETRRNIPRPPGAPAPKMQSMMVMGLFANFKNDVPYKVGSKWVLEISDSGSITLKEPKK